MSQPLSTLSGAAAMRPEKERQTTMNDVPRCQPVDLDDIPRVVVYEGEDPKGLPVFADGLPAQVFVVDRGFASDKLAIEFEAPHPQWGDTFATKHYGMMQPGRLDWGYDGRWIRLEHRAENRTHGEGANH